MDAKLLPIALATCLVAIPCTANAAQGTGPLTPAALHTAYSLPRTAAKRQTVAVVVAYDDPTIQTDLAVFSRRFSLPSCTRARGCLRVVNQRGQTAPLPARDPSGGDWTTEEALSAETLHGICQNCRLLLVEANTEGKGDLAAAVGTAERLGAREIATSYIVPEDLFDASVAPYYDHPGVVITAATGDSGFSYGTNVPASYSGVVAVGGTTLRLGRGNRWVSETVWHGSDGTTASGCSLFSTAGPWEAPYAEISGCGAKRAVPDVAAAAGPGAPLYSSTPLGPGQRGWFEAGGTSLASPIIAGVFALAGGVGPHQTAAAVLYAHWRQDPGAFHDITNGSDGSCGGRSICHAKRGYDGVTGVGTPRGIAGFRGN